MQETHTFEIIHLYRTHILGLYTVPFSAIEKYCLKHDDQAFCKLIGDLCDADGFVKPEDEYCKTD